MNRAQPIYDITNQMWSLLNQEITSKTREAVIEELNSLVVKRGTYMENLVSPYTDEEKQLGADLVKLNDRVQVRMQVLFTELKQEMKQMKKQKKSNQSYTNPYKSVHTIDGMFMDQKK